MLTQPKVLLVSADEAESAAIEKALHEHVILQCARTPLELFLILAHDGFDAILYTGSWSSGLQQVRQAFPDLPVLVLGRMGTDKEWADVLNAGFIDLLATPVLGGGVLPVLESAIMSFQARRWYNEVSDLMMTSIH